jgi:hypothetical protein
MDILGSMQNEPECPVGYFSVCANKKRDLNYSNASLPVHLKQRSNANVLMEEYHLCS